jgi:DNA-binding protein YbaB
MSEERDLLVEQMLQDYQSHRGKMTDMLQRMQEVNATATSPRREVTITVSQHGGMSDIKFTGTAYRRLAPNELSKLILDTLSEAKEAVVAQAAEVLAPMLPSSVNARDLLNGKLSVDAFAPEDGPRLPQVVREQFFPDRG